MAVIVSQFGRRVVGSKGLGICRAIQSFVTRFDPAPAMCLFSFVPCWELSRHHHCGILSRFIWESPTQFW